MIFLVAEYPCATCGTAVRIPMSLKPPTLPVKVEVVIPPLPAGWTYDSDGVHCPAHEPRRILPVTALPNLSMLNGRKH